MVKNINKNDFLKRKCGLQYTGIFTLKSMAQTFTITFGEVCENHVRNEQIGHLADRGFSLEELTEIRRHFDERGCVTELLHLNELLFDEDEDREKAEDAYVLVLRNGLATLLSENEKKSFYEEQAALNKDKKVKMYGRVVNKHARHNLCFADEGHAADYENGMGTVVAFRDVPFLERVREKIHQITNRKLYAEGNYYYDIKKCGIGYHGDAERRLVVGIRVGEEMPLHYRWYRKSKVVSKTLKLSLGNGDMYVMGDKAVGFDWKSRSKYTLRHAAGCKKYLDEERDITEFPVEEEEEDE